MRVSLRKRNTNIGGSCTIVTLLLSLVSISIVAQDTRLSDCILQKSVSIRLQGVDSFDSELAVLLDASVRHTTASTGEAFTR